MPTETELLHFIEVYSTRHFTRAAMRLGIAQPSLTQSILRLEEKVKAPLFHRTKQGCIPTKEAILLYDKATRLQELWKELSLDLSRSNQSLSGVFRVGCHPSVGAYTLPRFLEELSLSGPKIEIRLHHDLSRKITEKIVGYEMDLGFVVNPTRHKDLVLTKLGVDRIAFWRAKGKTPGPRIFADANMVQVQNILGKKSTKKFEDWQLIETPSLELIRTLVLQGAGVGILPERVARAEGAMLERADPTLPEFQDEIYLAYRMDTLKSLAGKALIAAARKVLV